MGSLNNEQGCSDLTTRYHENAAHFEEKNNEQEIDSSRYDCADGHFCIR